MAPLQECQSHLSAKYAVYFSILSSWVSALHCGFAFHLKCWYFLRFSLAISYFYSHFPHFFSPREQHGFLGFWCPCMAIPPKKESPCRDISPQGPHWHVCFSAERPCCHRLYSPEADAENWIRHVKLSLSLNTYERRGWEEGLGREKCWTTVQADEISADPMGCCRAITAHQRRSAMAQNKQVLRLAICSVARCEPHREDCDSGCPRPTVKQLMAAGCLPKAFSAAGELVSPWGRIWVAHHHVTMWMFPN